MRSCKILVAGLLAAAAGCGVASAQSVPQDRVYAFHSGAMGACPGLDWHVVASGTELKGMVSWGNMQHVARVSGTLNQNTRTFEMKAEETGTGRTATISGTITGDGWLVAQIDGPDVKCKAVQVHWFTPATFGGA